ncbi:MAG: OsmC family protein [Desulfocapsaceae bacterium]|nr:OsmC family protein [Desulfocapsaceae bacterium]
MAIDPETIRPDHMFDGGDLDCGSGLILLIRENMLQVPAGGILEMRSHEPTVADDLPPWCRMSGHAYLGKEAGQGSNRYFVRKGAGLQQEEESLRRDKEEARRYAWRLRARATGHLKSTIYARNFSFDIGQAASFEEKDARPCALEYLFGALAGSLATGFATECARDNLEVDDIELSLSGSLNNILAHMGLEEGDPSVQAIEVKCFASTFEDEAKVTAAWQRSIDRSPLAATLKKAAELSFKLVMV